VLKFASGLWKLNLNYWTMGKNTSDGPIWCSNMERIANISIIGYQNSTYQDKNCVQLRVLKQLGPNGYKLFTFQHELKKCSSKSMFACQVCKVKSYKTKRNLMN
jgi:hypothetical protein